MTSVLLGLLLNTNKIIDPVPIGYSLWITDEGKQIITDEGKLMIFRLD